MKRLILSIFISSMFLAIPCFGMDEIHLIKVRNVSYEVVEVLQRGKYDGKRFSKVRILNVGEPLMFFDEELTKDDLKELKKVPDFRPAEIKHPYRTWLVKQGPGVVVTALGFFI